MIIKNKQSQMVQGYLAGFNSKSMEMPECHKNASVAFKHGWLNGRDDRIGKPRDKAQILLKRANLIEQNSKLL